MRHLLILLLIAAIGCTPEKNIHEAIKTIDQAAVDSILKQQTDAIAEEDDQGRSPLHIAVQLDDPVLVAMLLEAGAKINALDTKGNTATDIADSIQEAKWNIGDPFAGGDPFANAEWDCGPQHDPFSSCDACDPFAGNEICQEEECTGESTAHPVGNPDDSTTWSLGVIERNNPVGALLAAYHGVNGRDLRSNFFDRIEAGDLEAVENMLKRNPKLINAKQGMRDNESRIALMIAVDNHDLKLVTLLVAHGGDPSAADAVGFPLTYRAIGGENSKMVDHLIANGAASSMHLEAMRGHATAIQKRLAAGENPNETDCLFSRPLDWAIAFKQQAAIDVLQPVTDPKDFTAAQYRQRAIETRRSLGNKGYPTTGAELNAWSPPPSGINGAVIVRDMLDTAMTETELRKKMGNKDHDRLPMIGAMPTFKLDRAKPLSGDAYNITKRYLGYRRPLIDACAQLRGVTESKYLLNLDPEAGEIPLPALNRTRNTSRILFLQALMAVADNNSTTAQEAVIDNLNLAATLRNDPSLISLLVMQACGRIAIQSLEHVVSQTTLSNKQLIELDHALLIVRPPDGYLRCMVAETVIGWTLFDHIDYHLLSGFGDQAVIPEPHFRLFRKSRAYAYDEWLHAAIMVRIVEVFEQPEERRREHAQKVMEWINAQPKTCKVSEDLFVATVPRRLSETAVVKQSQGFMYIDCARAGIAIERYRNKHKTLPKNLQALVPTYLPKVPADLLGEGNVRYTIIDNGYDITATGYSEKRPITFSVRKSGTR